GARCGHREGRGEAVGTEGNRPRTGSSGQTKMEPEHGLVKRPARCSKLDWRGQVEGSGPGSRGYEGIIRKERRGRSRGDKWSWNNVRGPDRLGTEKRNQREGTSNRTAAAPEPGPLL